MTDEFTELEETETIKPAIDYNDLTPGVDYQRVEAEKDATYIGEGQYVHHKEAVRTWNTITDCRELREVMGEGYGKRGNFDWGRKTYIAVGENQKWLEVEFYPRDNQIEGRSGFVVRMDIQTGNPLTVNEDKELVISRWTRESVVGLRNDISRLAGLPEENIKPVPRNKFADEIAASVWTTTDLEFADNVSGIHLTDEEKADPQNPRAQIGIAATVVLEMVKQGGSYTHQSEVEWFGLVRTGLKNTDGHFREEAVEEKVSSEVRKMLERTRTSGEIFADGVYEVEDTQGEVIQITTDKKSYAVRIMKRETGHKDGHFIIETKDYPEEDAETLLRASDHGLSGGRGWHGTPEDRAYVAQRYNFRLNRSLYENGFPVEARTAAAILEIQRKFTDRNSKEEGLQFAKENEDLIMVTFPDGAKRPMTWKDLLAMQTKSEKTENWETVGEIRRKQTSPEGGFSSTKPVTGNYFDRSDTEILVEESREIPLRARDIPKGIVVQKLEKKD